MASPDSGPVKVHAFSIGPNTQIGLSLSNLVTVLVVVAGSVLAYTRIPDESRVRAISIETTKTAKDELSKELSPTVQTMERRIGSLELQYAANQAELEKMNDRMDKMLVLLAGGSAGSLRSPAGRRAAEQVIRNIQGGSDPLSGLGLSESLQSDQVP